MNTKPVACFDDIVWFEPGVNPDELWDKVNATLPVVGEERHVWIRHGHQEPVGGRMWLLFQSALSVANGFPEPADEVENAAVIEVEILSQERLPRKRDAYGQIQYNAYVRCLQVIGLDDIAEVFAPMEPDGTVPIHWPEANKEVQLWETHHFTYVWIISQEIHQWFVVTKNGAPRLILECSTFDDEPFTICNCEWDWAKWPHRVSKPRR